MVRTGLVSKTFSHLKPCEIVKLTKGAGLEGIEWAGDVHVLPGDLKCAREVQRMTQEEGICIAAYGSYYIAGCPEANSVVFESVLETASALQAPNIRIWAGNTGSAITDEEGWERVVKDTRRAADLSQKAGIQLSFEYHRYSLTDTSQSAQKLMTRINHPNAFTYWQNDYTTSQEERCEGLKKISPWLSNAHIFYWKDEIRQALVDGELELEAMIMEIAALKKECFCMLEFVIKDDPNQFFKDAEVLKRMVQKSKTLHL